MKRSPLLIALLLPAAAFAQETRDLGAHAHGHSTLTIAVEGNRIAMELEAPGADITGFEYAAKSAEDRAKLEAAIAELSKPLSLFVLPEAAGCTVVSSTAGLHGAGEDHAGHDHEAHDHSEHEHGDDHAGHAEHAEFHAEYMLTCDNPAAIDRIEFTYFQTFPNAQEVDVQMISDMGAQGFEVTRDAPVLDLSGLI